MVQKLEPAAEGKNTTPGGHHGVPDSFAASTNNSSFIDKMLGDLGGAFSLPTVGIGLRLGSSTRFPAQIP
ncbi:hypothetical protein [Agrobacterium tumefaciens]|uniref:hypothetical protein n=1 Tax=Agrobacterium tumefaciens TaxID=358 RepID=UPI0021D10C52|nr:hypothetical protein [Agrobacterium tumefaciens]